MDTYSPLRPDLNAVFLRVYHRTVCVSLKVLSGYRYPDLTPALTVRPFSRNITGYGLFFAVYAASDPVFLSAEQFIFTVNLTGAGYLASAHADLYILNGKVFTASPVIIDTASYLSP